MDCKKWLENYIKQNQPIKPDSAYEVGKTKGFTRAEIKKARRWHGKFIDTQVTEDGSLWRWDP